MPGAFRFFLGIRCVVPRGRRVNPISERAAAYIAGLIDGEGTITLTRQHAHENRRLVVSIANTEIALLRFVLDEIGAGKITRKAVASDRHTPSYCYTVTSLQALALLEQITPHLRSYKKDRAELAIDAYERLTPRNGRYSPDLRRRRQEFEISLLSLKPHALTR
jgi:hypothetical protein